MASSKSLQSNTDYHIGRFVITVREVSVDPYAGLKGHEYLEARNLNKPVQRVQTSAHIAPASTQEAK